MKHAAIDLLWILGASLVIASGFNLFGHTFLGIVYFLFNVSLCSFQMYRSHRKEG